MDGDMRDHRLKRFRLTQTNHHHVHLLVKMMLSVRLIMPPTSTKLRGHIGLGLSVQSVSQSVCLSVMREHSVRNR